MMTFSDLKNKWDAMPVYANTYLLLDRSHPIEFNIGYEALSQKTLLVMGSGEIPDIRSSKSIIASNHQSFDGTWVLTFRLVQSDYEDVFLRFCWDIVESSRFFTGDKIEFVLNRYSKWLKLMEHIRQDVMSISMQKGLLGELLYLKELISFFGDKKAVQSWSGPEESDQDFVFDKTWTEVKSLSSDAAMVSISSIEQLDTDTIGSMRVYFFESTTPNDSYGLTLAQIVQEVRSTLSDTQEAKELFEHKIFMYGYIDNPVYDAQKYRLCKYNHYEISDNFPRLTKRNLNPAIIRIQYGISLAAIEIFKR